MEKTTGAFWRITISSGEGENRIRNAILIHCASAAMPALTLEGLRTGISMAEDWARKQYPERSDWVIYPPEVVPYFGEEQGE